MGRKKAYDRDALVQKAMALFRSHGYAGTSAEMLVEELGVNRYSLYAEFGSKQGLFDAALARYGDEFVWRRFGRLEVPGAGFQEIRDLFAFYGGSSTGPAGGKGCLLCNTAVEFGPEDPGGSGFVQAYFKGLTEAFLAALTQARDRGEIRTDFDLVRQADFLTASVLGLFVLLRAKAPAEMVERAADAANAHLETLLV